MSDTPPRLPPFFRLVAFDTVGSTSEEANRLASDGAAEGTLVWARAQSAGRGRRGRSWSSPPGNLYLSLILRPNCRPAMASQLGFVTAVGLGEALDALLPPESERPRYKWPNDLLVGGRKISGILLDASTGADGRLDWLAVGIGVNIASFPSETSYGATSLHEAGAGAVSVEQVLEVFAVHWLDRFEQWRREGFGPIREQWLARALALGDTVEVRLEREALSGRFVELGESGALILELPQGERRVVAAGDVCYPAF
jgi:BirA family biotin operon repressor/biotin-[acetyl-CoA-carboxylase] ligase